jgi:hypothetical protein
VTDDLILKNDMGNFLGKIAMKLHYRLFNFKTTQLPRCGSACLKPNSRRLRQEDCEFNTTLSYVMRCCLKIYIYTFNHTHTNYIHIKKVCVI